MMLQSTAAFTPAPHFSLLRPMFTRFPSSSFSYSLCFLHVMLIMCAAAYVLILRFVSYKRCV